MAARTITTEKAMALADAREATDPEAAEALRLLTRHRDTLQKLDREAATYVESVICLRTNFTGEPPYVGWKGLGLALKEALDERDDLKAKAARVRGRLLPSTRSEPSLDS